MSSFDTVNDMDGDLSERGEVCPHCNIVCNVRCDFWCLVRLKRRKSEDVSNIYSNTGFLVHDEARKELANPLSKDSDHWRCELQSPCLLYEVGKSERTIVLELLNTMLEVVSLAANAQEVIRGVSEHTTSYNLIESETDQDASTPTECTKQNKSIMHIFHNPAIEVELPEDSPVKSPVQDRVGQVTPTKRSEDLTCEELSLAHSPTRVQFSPTLVSEVHFRDKVSFGERRELFYSVLDESQGRMDKMKEIYKAKALGMTWMEWMEKRIDEDVA